MLTIMILSYKETNSTIYFLYLVAYLVFNLCFSVTNNQNITHFCVLAFTRIFVKKKELKNYRGLKMYQHFI